MIKLLRAGFFRLKKEATFYLFIVATLGIAIFRILTTSHDIPLNKVLYDYILYIGLFIAVFVSIFVGKEHSEGIIRNKIIVGHSRTSVYISKLIISIVVSILCELIYIAFMFIIGTNIYEKLQIPVSQLIMIILNTMLIIALYCSILNCITMICSEITVSTVICVITVIIMFVAEFFVSQTANCTKYMKHSVIDSNGVETIINQGLNPNYPGDEAVKIAKTVELLLPTGQADRLISSAFTDPDVIKNRIFTKEEVEEKVHDLYKMPLYSIAVISAINIVGICLFSRKELK